MEKAKANSTRKPRRSGGARYSRSARRHFLIPKLGAAEPPPSASNDNAVKALFRQAVHDILDTHSGFTPRVADLIGQASHGRLFVMLTLTAKEFDALVAWDAANDDVEPDDNADGCEAEEMPISGFERMQLGDDDEDDDPPEESDPEDENGDEGDYSNYGAASDNAIVDAARARYALKAEPEPSVAPDGRCGRWVKVDGRAQP